MTIKHASDGFVWLGFSPPPYCHRLSPLRPPSLGCAFTGGTYQLPIALGNAFSPASLSLSNLLVTQKRKKGLMKDGVFILFSSSADVT